MIRRGPRRRGFTLIEVVLIVAIIGILVALGVGSLGRASLHRTLRQESVQLETRIQYARALAELAGARLGTPQFQNCTSVNGVPTGHNGNHLSVVVDRSANTILVPVSLRLQGGPGDIMESACELRDTDNTRIDGAPVDLVGPGPNPIRIAFSALGRAYNPPPPPVGPAGPAGTPASWQFVLQDSTRPSKDRPPGFRVLPSGVLCQSSDPAVISCDRN